jgi:hypothetical protein
MPAQTGQAPPSSAPPQSNLGDEIGAFAKYQGETVTDIEFRGIAGADPAMLRSLLAQKTNEPLDRDQLRASLQALYATGRFATLQVEVEPGPQKTLTSGRSWPPKTTLMARSLSMVRRKRPIPSQIN